MLSFRQRFQTSIDLEPWEIRPGIVKYKHFKFGHKFKWYRGVSHIMKDWDKALSVIKFDEILIDSKWRFDRNNMIINFWNAKQREEFLKALESDKKPDFVKLSNIK